MAQIQAADDEWLQRAEKSLQRLSSTINEMRQLFGDPTKDEKPPTTSGVAAPPTPKGALKPILSTPEQDKEIAKVHSAVRWNKPEAEVVQAVSNAGMNMVNALAYPDPKNGNRALHIAAQNGHAALTKFLIAQKADVRTQNNKGQTALHMSVEYDFYFQSKFLLSANADPLAKNNDGQAALSGIDGGKTGSDAWDAPLTILKAAENDKEQLDFAFKALESYDLAKLDKADFAMTGMKKKKECKENWDANRFMALMSKIPDAPAAPAPAKAAAASPPANAAADASAKAAPKATAKMMGALQPKAAADAAPAGGADVKVAKIHSAIRWNKPQAEIVEVVSAVGSTMTEALALADPKNGNKCLHISAQNGHMGLTKFLIEQKAEVNTTNGKGQTPLHMSIEYDFYFQSKYLLEAKANPTAKNNDGHEAMLGIDGTKTGSEAWDYPIIILKAADNDKEQLEVAFKALEQADLSAANKGDLAMAGMKKKKECGANWDAARFMAIMNKL